MNPLIPELKAQHEEILDKLSQAKKAGITSPKGKKLILDSKKIIIRHIQLEDENLYPKLKMAAKSNRIVEELVNGYIIDMDSISKKVFKFFQDCEKGIKEEDYATRIGRLLGLLGTRIRKEEMFLFKEYEKLEC